MASDVIGRPVPSESNITLSISLSDHAEAQRIFNAMSEGGKVMMPFQKTFWAEGFGMLTDKFGIGWMVNCD